MSCGSEDNGLFDETSKDFVKKLLNAFDNSYGYIHGYISSFLCLFGLITNLVHIVVLTRPKMRCSAVNVILTGMAICDTGTMISYLIYVVHFIFDQHSKNRRPACVNGGFGIGWIVFLISHMYISITLHNASLWLAVTLAFIRNMTLRRVRKASKWADSNRSWTLIVIVFCLVSLLSLPNILFHEIQPVANVCPSNVSMTQYYTLNISVTAMQNGCQYFKWNLWVTGIFFKLIPCMLLLILILGLVQRLQEVKQKRGFLLARNRKRHTSDRTTTMLTCILAVFLITEVPQGVVAVLSALYTNDFYEFYADTADFLDLLSLLNCCVSFILYCLMSSKYRQTFWEIFGFPNERSPRTV